MYIQEKENISMSEKDYMEDDINIIIKDISKKVIKIYGKNNEHVVMKLISYDKDSNDKELFLKVANRNEKDVRINYNIYKENNNYFIKFEIVSKYKYRQYLDKEKINMEHLIKYKKQKETNNDYNEKCNGIVCDIKFAIDSILNEYIKE